MSVKPNINIRYAVYMMLIIVVCGGAQADRNDCDRH